MRKYLNTLGLLPWSTMCLLIVSFEGVLAYKCKASDGTFINVCGKCIEESNTSSQATGQDKCGVCYGSNECDPCDDSDDKDKCMKCLTTDDTADKCVAITDVFPRVVDLAAIAAKVVLTLNGPGINHESLGDIKCFLQQQNVEEANEIIRITEIDPKGIHLTLDSSSLTYGSYTVYCNTSSTAQVVCLRHIRVVDSRQLEVSLLAPSSVSTDAHFQPILAVPTTQVNETQILCFMHGTGFTETVVRAVNVTDGKVQCNTMMAKRGSSVFIGVSRSLEAAINKYSILKSIEIPVNSPEPSMKKAEFSSDLRQIRVYFDQNIKSSQGCRNAFTPETVSLFGKGWRCWFLANQLVVQLGQQPAVRPGSRLVLSESNGIQRAHSDTSRAKMAQESAVIVDDITDQVVEPLYKIKAPQFTCKSSKTANDQQPYSFQKRLRKDDLKQSAKDTKSFTTVEVQELGAQSLLYSWSVSFNPPQNGLQLNSQRDMLMVWLSARLLDKSVKKVTTNKVNINNNLMLTGVEYTLTVHGINALGVAGEEKKIPLKLLDNSQQVEHRSESAKLSSGSCASGVPLDIVLLTSPAAFSDAECSVEVSVSCCDGEVLSASSQTWEYMWSVQARNHTVDVASFHGKRLVIPPGLLRGGESYNVTCSLLSKENGKISASASTSLLTLERGIQSRVNVTAVVISTNHRLILDASGSEDLDNKLGSLEFEWSCRTTLDLPDSADYGEPQCVIPGQDKRLLSEVHRSALKQPLLDLPAGSLSIGRYIFSIQVSKDSKRRSSLRNVEVVVVGGLLPVVYIPSHSTENNNLQHSHVVSPEDVLSISGFVSGLKAGCHVSWSGVEKTGYAYLNQTLLHQEPYLATAHESSPHEFVVELSPGLIGDATYCLRLSVLCADSKLAELGNSYADVEIVTDSPPVVEPLLIEPLVGEAMVTKFQFSTQPAYDDLSDYPLQYSFGFRLLDQDGRSNPNAAKFFQTSTQQLGATTYLPASSLNTTKIQGVLKVCDVRRICHSVDGPLVSVQAPSKFTPEQVELLSDGFSSLLAGEEYESAVMLVDSGMMTLELLGDKSLYELASQKVEASVKTQLKLFENSLDNSPGSVHAPLGFLNAANAALKHGAFSQETLQRLVAFKDKILNMISVEEKNNQGQREKRQVIKSESDSDYSRNILDPEMVRALVGVSETAILNLSDSKQALIEKSKLLQNVSFFMDSLCRGLVNYFPVFIGSRVVSFSVQRLNMLVKYKDELAIPDWRSAKSGGTPVNATALIKLRQSVKQSVGSDTICMGGAFYPMDYLSEVSGISRKLIHRHSSIYYVKVMPNSKPGKARKPLQVDGFDGIDVGQESVHITIPVWKAEVDEGFHLECQVWHNRSWDGKSCNYTTAATLQNNPAVKCECQVLGYHGVFAVPDPIIPTNPPTVPTTQQQLSESSAVPVSPAPTPSLTSTQASRNITLSPGDETSQTSAPKTTEVQTESLPTVTQPPTMLPTTSRSPTSPSVNQPPTPPPTTNVVDEHTEGMNTVSPLPTQLPAGVPIANTTQNFTFRIQEDFSSTVGSNRDAFIRQLKKDILEQVEMPSNMITSIDIEPGSIVVTLHLVDTDVRAVADVLPTLAAALQEGRLSVNGLDGKHLSIPSQSLLLLQHRTDTLRSAVPWIAAGCATFSVICIASLVVAALIVKRKQHDLQFVSDPVKPEIKVKAPAYGRFHLEQTMDGSEATLSRYRSSSTNPLIVSTVGGFASVMGTNVMKSDIYMASDVRYKLQSPQVDGTVDQTKEPANINSTNTTASSGSSSSSSVQRRTDPVKKQYLRTGDKMPILHCQDDNNSIQEKPEEEDLDAIGNDASKVLSRQSSNGSNRTPDSSIVASPPDVVILPGTPTERGSSTSQS